MTTIVDIEESKSDPFARMPTDSESLQLAPAAGAGIGKLLAQSLLSDPEFLPLMKAAAIGGLKASRSYWDKATGGSITEPDFRVQIQTVALLLAHMEGEPIKRVIHQHLSGEGPLDPLAAIRESPALQAAVERTLEKARWRQSGRKRDKSVEIEV